MSRRSINILSLTAEEFIRSAEAFGTKAPQARLIYRRVMRDGADDTPEWVDLPGMAISAVQEEDQTRKFTLRMHDGLETESVILPQLGRTGQSRSALCVSSQIGCARGCEFCETAQMGLIRNLTAGEVIAQWRTARFSLAADISNIVFMGMGEPMDNLDAVINATRIFADHDGPAISSSRISVSTAGLPRGIARLASLAEEPGFRRLGLAVSLNAPNDGIRSRIMPINRTAPMADLMKAMLRWPVRNRGRILIEYVLIPGVNDAIEHADELCAYLQPLRCTLNVIPHNPRRESPWPAPSPEDVRRFVDRAVANGIFVKRRKTMGRSISGACGQLSSRRTP